MSTPFAAGTRVVARDIRIANPRQTKWEATTYRTATVRGTVQARSPLVFVGFGSDNEPQFRQGPARPDRDASGRYWVMPDRERGGPQAWPVLIHHDEMQPMEVRS